MKTKHNSLLPAAMLLACACLPASAANILSDDFESYTVGANISAQSNWNADNRAGNVTVQNTGLGTSNKYAEINDTSTGGFNSMVHTTKIDAGQTVTFSLNFIALNDQQMLFGFSGNTNAAQVLGSSTVARVALTDGAIAGSEATSGFGSGLFSLDTAYELKMVFNDSGASITYAGRSLADNFYDVWIRNLTASGSTYVGTGTFTSVAGGYYSAARSNNAPTPNYLIDNWRVDEGAIVTAIPEPTAALAGLLLGLGLLRRRRQGYEAV